MQWTTEKPSQSGYYWGYENLDEIDADVILVHVNHDSQQCFGLGVTFSVDDFSHWIGPLSIPVNPHHSYSGQDIAQFIVDYINHLDSQAECPGNRDELVKNMINAMIIGARRESVQLSQPDNLPIRHLSSVEKE